MQPREHDVAACDDLDAAGLLRIDVDGTAILLSRNGDAIRAVGATCPHAGAPLEQGVHHGDRIVCPWHKAVFCLRTGAVLEPPALDRLPRYDARIANGRILVTLPARTAPDAPPAPPDPRCFVIIGAGAAGAVAAQTLRETGFAGRIVMLDRENRVPYDRTLLSKYVLSGEQGGEKSPLQSQSFYRSLGIERRTAEVTVLSARDRRITCADGTVLAYDAALLATGATPIRPDLPGATLANAFVLRTRADADAIVARAEQSERAVILGESFIGMEVAASLRERGLDVTVIGQGQVPFERVLGSEVGAAFTALHEARGVRFRLGCKVMSLHGDHAVRSVHLAGGETLPADLVVIGAGVRPATGFAHDLPTNPDGGIPVDAGLRAADGLYAAGDIASFPVYGDGERIRVEHWRVAQQHGRVAALNMAGHAARADAPPVFWTIQYMKRLDYVGHAASWNRVVVHGDLQKPEFLAYYIRDGLVAAACGLDRDQDTAALVELFTLRRTWTAEQLGANPAAVLAAQRQE